jgi:CMP-N,N'-diacetyllegionaminic acid synthase
VNVVTVIPARGGSKSIPLKNIQLLNGRPLIEYTIKYSIGCELVRDTVVSTDLEQIAKIARDCGATVPFMRPEEISGDDVQDFPVIHHALTELEKIYNEKIDAIVLLRPTSPLRPILLIEKALSILKKFPNCTSVRSVVKTSEHPYRQWVIDGDKMVGYETGVDESYNLPRQKLPSLYFQSGDVEVIRRETILAGSISGMNIAPLVIERSEMLDIDIVSDLEEAEKKLKNEK